MMPVIDVPKDKHFPLDSVQCDSCGGNGCDVCGDKGWLTPANHPIGRRCEYAGCNMPLAPYSVSVYCSNVCADDDK
jgi:hypothetical protein